MTSPGFRTRAGFSLVELIVVITITGILGTTLSNFIARPMAGYRDLTRRAGLVDRAELTLRRMARDVRRSLPNSLRISGNALELLHTADGGRYRREGGVNGGGEDHTAASDWLSFGDDDEFNLLGRFQALSFSYGTPLTAGTRLAVYPTGSSIWSDAATGADPGPITPTSTTLTISDDVDEDHLTLSSSFRFLLESPNRRLYVVDTPVSYLCDPVAEEITRYWSYPVAAGQPTNPAAAPLSSASSSLMADRVASCSFTYDPGTPTRAGLLSMALVLTDSGESIRLLHQVHVDNAP